MKNRKINRKNIKLDLLLLYWRYWSLASNANFPKPIIKLINEPNKAPNSIQITIPKTKKTCGNLASVLKALRKASVIYNTCNKEKK